ncbi:MAG: LpxL/LpxP family Kdo(2)-lipid IV(A) lauroyl/palmitoleoyl acyltransferase [Pseudomonadales bacterium]
MKTTFDPSLLQPKYWPSWLAILLLRIVAILPFRAKLIAGQGLGWLAFHLVKKRRHTVQTNVRLCFPELNAIQQKKMVRDIFAANGIGFFEIAWAWWANIKDIEQRYDIEGLEHIEAAKADGSGVLLVGAHFVHLDLCGLMANHSSPMGVIYRKNNNPVFEYIITKGRNRFFENVIERSDMRNIVRQLRDGKSIWYSPDQDFGRDQAVFAPFFGIQAATLVATSRLAKMGRAKPIGIAHYRDPVTHRYRIVLTPVNEAFPTGDDQKDATLINAMLEKAIRVQPEQYMWVHRRFKTRPEGEPSLY